MFEVISWVFIVALMLFAAFTSLCYFIFVQAGGYMVTLEKIINDEDKP
jgi:hypothetical protein